MRVRPVLDLLEGCVVRGVGGRRDQYRPIVSRLTSDSSPRSIARSLSETFGFRDFYVADLDAILHGRPNLHRLEQLAGAGFRLAVDAGVKSAADVDRLLAAGIETVILGLESLANPDQLTQFAAAAWNSQLLFSVDLQGGQPLATAQWPATDLEIVETVVAAGINRVLVLDLADVGTGQGSSTQTTIRGCRMDPRLQDLWSGGGVRGPEDLRQWQEIGVDEVLVASALHDGRLSLDDVARYVA